MIEITEDTINRVQTILADVPRGAERALTNAINRSLTMAKSQSYKGVMAEYSIKRGVIKEYTSDSIEKASTGDICGVVRFAGEQIPLYKYSGTRPSAPVKGKVFAGQKSPKAFEHAFYTNVTASKAGIFEREGKSRLPITQIMGSSMRSMVSNAVVMEQVYEETQEMFDKRLEHEIERLLAGYGG